MQDPDAPTTSFDLQMPAEEIQGEQVPPNLTLPQNRVPQPAPRMRTTFDPMTQLRALLDALQRQVQAMVLALPK